MNSAEKDYRIVVAVSLCLAAAVILVYGKAKNFDFVGYDDELYVTQNQYVQKGISLEGIKWAFTTFRSANWHPLTWLSHMLDCELYGLNPTGHHWTSIELHIANTLLLFFILFKMTGTLWQSAFAAALFALHPLHVESVAWVSERKDVLSTFFGLLCIGAYCLYVKKSSVPYYMLAVSLLILGLMAKPMLVTLPFVLLLLDFWPLKRMQFQRNFIPNSIKPIEKVIRSNCRIIIEKIPFFILVGGACIVTFFAQKSEGAVKALWALPMKYRIENAVVSYVTYIFKAIWPHKLAVFYPHPGNTLPWWQFAGGALLIIAVCYGGIKSAKKYPYILVGTLWYLGTLVPVIGLVQVGDQAMADRYTYIPLIGIFIIVSWGISDLFKLIGDQRLGVGSPVFAQRAMPGKQKSEILSGATKLFNKRRFRKIFFGISALIILFALSWTSFLQLNTWKNGITLFEHAVSVTKNNYQAYNNLGKAYESTDLDKALFHYKAALNINPNDAAALYNQGTIYEKKGRLDEAISHYSKALQVNPNYFEALNNLGLIFYDQGNYDRAVLYFKKAIKTKSKKSSARMNLANVLFLQSKPDEAVSQYQKILQTDPANADVHYNLACVLYSQNKINEAVSHYKKTLKIDPKYSKAYYNLGNILLGRGKIKKAVAYFSKAIQFKPDYVQVYNKLGMILLKQGKLDKAKVFFSKAVGIDPNYSEASKNLEMLRRPSSMDEH
jgi:protein O-mannosyl-transferase